MPAREYIGWQEFAVIEPFGMRVQDAMHAHSLSVLANVNRNPEQRKEPYGIKDFLLFPDPEREVPEATVEGKTAAQWKLIFAAEALAAQQKARA